MTEETIEASGETHAVETERLTVIIPSSNHVDRIKYPERMEIGFQDAVHHAERVQKWHESTASSIRKIMDINGLEDITPDSVRSMGTGMVSLSGFVDLSLKLRDMKVPIALKYPESGLHPGRQARLADFFNSEFQS